MAAGKDFWSDDETVKAGSVGWEYIANQLSKRRAGLQEKFEKLDMEEGKAGAIKSWYIDDSRVADSL